MGNTARFESWPGSKADKTVFSTIMKKSTEQQTMPRFQQTIEIKVEVDTIYDKLMATFPEDYKHKEILSHAIIGSALVGNSLGYIYNALSGYTNDIDFKEGDVVMCTVKDRDQWTEEVSTDSEYAKWKVERIEIGECEIIEINLYEEKKLKVRFKESKYKSNEMVDSVRWVDHKSCTKLPGLAIPDAPINKDKYAGWKDK